MQELCPLCCYVKINNNRMLSINEFAKMCFFGNNRILQYGKLEFSPMLGYKISEIS